MDYEIEDLLPLVAELTDKYTSKQSSSVTYENAQMLMEAILYCIREFECSSQNMVATQAPPSAKTAWQEGCRLVFDKVCRAKELYDELINTFNDYGCQNYSDTIRKGMPQFFLRYDPKFNPQNHLLTLDYPLLGGYPPLCGADLILSYLEKICDERDFLDSFDDSSVRSLMESVMPDYQECYMDNLCKPVLFRALCCMIAEKPVRLLNLNKEDWQNVIFFFNGDSVQQAEHKLKNLTDILAAQLFRNTSGVNPKKLSLYLQTAAKDFALRLIHMRS